MTWVWDHSRATGSDRLVLLAIADCANDVGNEAWPSLKSIASKARVSEATVKRSIVALSDLGELIVDSGGGRATNRYRVVMELAQPELAQSDTGCTGELAASSSAQNAPYIEPSMNRHSARATRLPVAWLPTDADLTWAREQHIPASVLSFETGAFVDYWRAKGGKDATRVNWSLTWRNWMRNWLRRNPGGTTGGRAKPEW